MLEHLETWDLTTLNWTLNWTSPRLRLAAFPPLRAAALGDASVLCAAAATSGGAPLLHALIAAGAPLATGTDVDCPLRAAIANTSVSVMRGMLAATLVNQRTSAPMDLDDARPGARDALCVACEL